MTLSTNVYVLDEIDPLGVFLHCQELLAKYDDKKRPAIDQRWVEDANWRPGVTEYRNLIGQSLPAILEVRFRREGALVTQEQSVAHDEDCEPDCDGRYHQPACWLVVDFDTAYGYRDDRGWSCGDLHAMLVAELGAWLTEAGVGWKWQNEFTGQIHGDDNPESLIELVSGGQKATDWFRHEVLPLIAAVEATR